MVVGPARDQAETFVDHRRAQGAGVGHDVGRIATEFGAGRLCERHRFGGDDMFQRATLQAREHRTVDLLRQVGAAEDGASPRAAQRLVRRERDHVRHPDRAGMGPACDEAGRVGGIEHEERPDRVGDLAERQRVDGAGVRGGARHNEGRLLALGQISHLIEVDDLARGVGVLRGRGNPVGDETPDLRGDRRRRAVRQVPPVIEPHGENGGARLQ